MNPVEVDRGLLWIIRYSFNLHGSEAVFRNWGQEAKCYSKRCSHCFVLRKSQRSGGLWAGTMEKTKCIFLMWFLINHNSVCIRVASFCCNWSVAFCDMDASWFPISFLMEGCFDVSCLLQLFSKGDNKFFIPGPEEKEEDRGFKSWLADSYVEELVLKQFVVQNSQVYHNLTMQR